MNSIEYEQIEFYMRVPYVSEFEVVADENDNWWCIGSYPEIEGTTVRCGTVLETLDALEKRKYERILELLTEGQCPPVPRHPLAIGAFELLPEFLSRFNAKR